MYDFVGAFKSGCEAVAKVFGFAQHRSELNNAADVKKAALAAQEQKQHDAANKAIAKGDDDEIRKLTSE